MCCQVGNASDCIALYFDVRRHHLANQGLQTTKLDDGDFVFSWKGEQMVCGIRALTYCSLPDYQGQHLPLVVPQGPDFAARTRSVVACLDRPLVHL